MIPRTHRLTDGRDILIREAETADAGELLKYMDAVTRESDFLSMAPGEFTLTEAQEEAILRAFRDTDNRLYIVAVLDGAIVGMLAFGAGERSRIRHAGELSMSVRREQWGGGIGSVLLDELIAWARASDVVTKINLRVRSDHARAIALYERKGFTTEGMIRREICVDGVYYDHRCMGMEV